LFNIEHNDSEPIDYAIAELSISKVISPLMTVYRSNEKIISLKFPQVESSEQRLQTLKQASWVSGVFGASAIRFIVDSNVLTTKVNGDKVPMDALITVYANSTGCWGYASPYFMHPESTEPIWQSDNTVSSDDILDSQPSLVAFAASQFFFRENPLPWTSYRKYLIANGFEFLYHGRYNEDNIGATMKTLV
jgi:hypothetical protein